MDEMIRPSFRERAARVLRERGASPFVGARFFRLPVTAQVFGLGVLEAEPARDVRELITELEEDAERLERSRRARK